MTALDSTLQLCLDEIDNSDGAHSDEVASNQKKALDYYYNKDRGDEAPGVSDIQSSDVADMVNAVLAQMVPSFSGDTIVSFDPMAEDDEVQAQLESDVVSDCIMHKNRGYTLFMGGIKNALMLRNGWIRVDVEEKQRMRSQDISELDDEQRESLLTEIPGATVEGNSLKTETKTKRVNLVNVDPGRIRYTQDWDSPYLEDIPFFAEQQLLTRSQLVQLGVPRGTVEDLAAYTAHADEQQQARSQTDNNDLTREERSQELINTFVCYVMVDEDNTGASELRRVHVAYDNKKKLFDDSATFIPYATGTPFITPNRLLGESLADHLFTIQDSKTHFLRQWHENAKRANKAGTIAAKGANLEDLKEARTNGIYRENVPGLIRERMFTDVGPSMQLALGYLDKIRTERGGSSLDMGSADFQLAGQVGDQGAERQISVKEQLAAMMTKTLAETLLRDTYKLVHMTYREHFSGNLIKARIRGQWQETDPGEWPERDLMTVKPGMSVAQRSRRDAALRTVIQEQKELIAAGKGGILTDESKYYNSILDWLRAAELDAPEQYFIDPSSEPAQQAAQQQAEQAQQQGQQQVEFIQQMQRQEQQFEAYKAKAELQFKYFDAWMKGEIEEAKIVGNALQGLQDAQDAAAASATAGGE